MATITAKTFNTRLSQSLTSLTNQRQNIQDFIVFGLRYFAGMEPSAEGKPVEPGNPLYLTVLMQKLTGISTVRESTIQNFIQAHASVIWGKDKTGAKVFKPKGEFRCEIPTTNWWLFDKAGKDRPDYDFNKAVAAFIKKAQDNSALLNDTQKAAMKAMADAYAETMTGISNKGQDSVELPAAVGE